MQDWRKQAEKNNLPIKKSGSCQLCGAWLSRGIEECVELSGLITHVLDHQDGIRFNTIFLCVDAHALSHAEIHGRWNNHYHLSRLQLILKEKIHWNYQLSPLLSNIVDAHKYQYPDEQLPPPPAKRRGEINIVHVDNAITEEEYIRLVFQWAQQVYDAFSAGHPIVQHLAQKFISQHSKHIRKRPS